MWGIIVLPMDIFKNTQFLKLWGNQILLQIAFNMSNFTAILLISHMTSSRLAIAQFYAAMTLPAFVVGLFAGAVVDLSNRKHLMLLTDALLAGLFFCYALSINYYWPILVIAFLSASVAQFFTPAEAATIPSLVKGAALEKANALFLFTGLGSVMIGYALAGPVIDYFTAQGFNGVRASFLLASSLTVVGFFLRLSLRTIETTRPVIESREVVKKTLQLTHEVFELARSNRKISVPILLLTVMEFNIGMLAIIFLDYVKKYLNLPETATSYFLVLPLIIGLGSGVTLLGRLEQQFSKGKQIYFGGVVFGFIILLLGVSAKLLGTEHYMLLRSVTLFTAFIVGIAVVIVSVHSRTILQEETPENMLGRVFSLVTVGSAAVTPIPILIIAFITEKLDVSTVFLLLGGLLLLGVNYLRPTLQKSLA